MSQVPCDDCRLQFEPIKDEKLYKVTRMALFHWNDNDADVVAEPDVDDDNELQVVMTEYLAGGGDGFTIIANNKEKHLQVPPWLCATTTYSSHTCTPHEKYH